MPQKNESECCCEKPDRLKGKPDECTPEQIRVCHGETEKHPCCHPRDKKKTEG